MTIKEIKTADLKPYANNPRNNDAAVDAVASSIKQFGFKVPIVIDKDNVIVAGHTRLKAAEKLGLDKVPCIIADDLTEEQIKAFRLADNKTAELAEWDFNALAKEIADLDTIDVSEFGFDEADISPEQFDEEFELPDGDKGEFQQITFTLHNEQAELIKYALETVDECKENFGNTNKNGNALYEVVRQWAEQKKSS